MHTKHTHKIYVCYIHIIHTHNLYIQNMCMSCVYILKKAVPLSCELVPVDCECPLHKHSGLVVNKGIRT